MKKDDEPNEIALKIARLYVDLKLQKVNSFESLSDSCIPTNPLLLLIVLSSLGSF